MLRLWRFADLKANGVAKSWPQLKRLQQRQGFPAGRLLGPQTRVWTEEEIVAWFAARPVENTTPPRGAVKRRLQRELEAAAAVAAAVEKPQAATRPDSAAPRRKALTGAR